ncbi:hypothetical protein OE766_18815 [Pararhizobium sp. YC-54]|uniref:hypothetical protein n=1 Tax=Pararhizobium sp. YC-54 TaxID=2986920 RepID=UPI0021F75B56|nr:hypothetical protein [Pararhizobium sp. YC-54]MCW0000290.1 hypothetical protein [Pararhizobium sp. YC-54]
MATAIVMSKAGASDTATNNEVKAAFFGAAGIIRDLRIVIDAKVELPIGSPEA